MPETLETYGTFGGYQLALVRRPRVTDDVHLLTGNPRANGVITLSLTKGAAVKDIGAVEDVGPGSGAGLATAAKTVAAAFAAVGISA